MRQETVSARAAEFGGTPAEIGGASPSGGEILVNTTTTGEQSSTWSTGLAGGGFVVTWADFSGNAMLVRAQVFDAAGSRIGGEVTVNTGSAPLQAMLPVVTGLTNGNFVVTWHDSVNDGSGNAQMAQIFSATGTKIGGEFRVNTSTSGAQEWGKIAALANGGFVIGWEDNSGALDTAGYGVTAQIFSASGAKVGGEILINNQTAGDEWFESFAGLANGNFVATWHGNSGALGDTSANAVSARIFAPDGTPLGAEFRVNTSITDEQRNPMITALDNGGFVITWRDRSLTMGDANGYSVKAQIYTAGGTPVGGEFLVNTGVQADQSLPNISALKGGGFVIAWGDYSGTQGDTGVGIRAQVFDDLGTKVGDEFHVNTSVAGNQIQPSVSGLADGGFLISWSDFGNNPGDTDGAVRAQRFGPAGISVTGTTGADQLFGSNLHDTISGGDGNDVIHGLAGNDVIGGGIGTDTIYGEAGNDTIDGGGGNDIIYASAGHDIVDGGANTDRLVVSPVESSLFPGSGAAESYTVTANHLGNGSGTLDTSFTNIERIDITDQRAGNSTVDTSAFTGTSVTAPRVYVTLGAGDHVVRGGPAYDTIILGIGSSNVDGGASTGNGVASANTLIMDVDGSIDAPVRVTGTSAVLSGNSYTPSTIYIDYISGGVARHTVATNVSTWLRSGTDHGLFVDATDAPLGYNIGFIATAGGSQTIYTEAGLAFVDSNYDDVEIGSRYTDDFASAANGTGTINGGTDWLLGNGGADLFDYELEITNFRGDHILDFDADDAVSLTYYQDPASSTVEPTFIGTAAFTGAGREIRYYTADGKTYLQTDIDGDKIADGTVVLDNGAFQLVGVDRYGFGGNAGIKLATAQNIITGTDAAQTTNGSSGDDVIRAYGGNDTLNGGNGNDQLNGGKGADTMAGGAGDDVYYVDDAGDVVVEAANAGTDSVISYRDYTLTANVERLTLAGTAALSGTGNAIANSLYGNSAGNALNGAAGDDTLQGLGGDDILDGGAGNDVLDGGDGSDTASYASATAGVTVRLSLTAAQNTGGGGSDKLVSIENLTGSAFADTLLGTSGVNHIDGGAGADDMRGGKGDDFFVVDNAGDKVIELDGEGSDTIDSSVSYSLAGQYVEVLNLTGTAAINGTGNGLANRIVGNSAANTLVGGDGSDRLDGGAGADTLKGGTGNDVYVVDQTGDRIVENDGEGTDTVEAYFTYSLAGQYIEILKLMGTGDFNGNGNGLANTLYGNSGANVLNGMAGADTMYGGAGNDTYYVDDAGDRVFENAGEGTDTVQSSVSFTIGGQYVEIVNLTGTAAINATGNSQANILNGNAAVNVLNGGGGDDALHGGLGSDTLTGGAGADTYWFETALGATNVDRISDFSAADDTIYLDRTIFAGIAVNGALNPNAFWQGAAAHDADDRIVYDKATGNLWYDADGNGAGTAILFATVATNTAMTAADFFAVA